MRQDLRYAARTLRKNLGFAAIVVLTLALGIGADSAIFAVVNRVLLTPLPFREPDRLCLLYERTPAAQRRSVSYPNYLDWQRSTRAFSSLAAFRRDNLVLSGAGRPQRLRAAMISAGFLSTLGVSPIVGREFQGAEDQLGSGGVALISENFWKTRYAGGTTVLGNTLELNGSAYAVVGVVPDAVRTLKTALFTPADVYIPVGQWRDPSFRDRKVTTGLSVIGRLAPGTGESSAAAEMSHIAANLAIAFPDANRDVGITIVPLRKQLVGAVQPMLLVLLAGVTFVLLIACANVASLLLVRSTGRMKEFATRAALGASPARVVLQLLTEAVFLALIGGAAGLALGVIGARVAKTLVSVDVPRLDSVAIDGHVLAFTFAVSLAAGVLFGLAPAVKILRLNLGQTLKEGGRASGNLRRSAQKVFVLGEVAIALVLLVGAGLMIRTLQKLLRVQPGFDPHNVLVFDISPSPATGTDAQQLRMLFRHLSERLETIAAVNSASMLLDPLPLSGSADVVAFDVPDRPTETHERNKTAAMWSFVSPDYFRAMGVILKRGRTFQLTDDEHAPQVAIIDEAFARSMFPNEDPIGKRIHIGYTGTSQIVGVVAHVNHWALSGEPANLVARQMYFPYAQLTDKYLTLGAGTGATVVVRTHSDPLALVPTIKDEVSQLDNGLAIFELHTMDEAVAAWLATRRFVMIALAIFAALALTLSAIGIYGVISYIVGQRTPEIGIRMALGAQARDIAQMILRQAGSMAAAGLVIGITASLLLSRLMSSLLFGISPADPLSLSAASALLLAVALASSYLPSQRAMRIDPLAALRGE